MSAKKYDRLCFMLKGYNNVESIENAHTIAEAIAFVYLLLKEALFRILH